MARALAWLSAMALNDEWSLALESVLAADSGNIQSLPVVDDDDDEWGRVLAALDVTSLEEQAETGADGPVPIMNDSCVEDLPLAPLGEDKQTWSWLEWAHLACRYGDGQLDEDTTLAARHCLQRTSPCMSMSAKENSLNIHRKKLRTVQLQAASSSLQLERLAWKRFMAGLQHGVSAGVVEPVMYLEYVSYDVVDFTLQSRSTNQGQSGPAADPGQEAGESTASTGLCKVLHTECGGLVMMKVHGKLVVTSGLHLCALQGMDRCTAENMVAALRHASHTADANIDDVAFVRKLRLVVTDGAPNNKKTERHLGLERSSWITLHVGCNLHVISGIHAKVFNVASQHVSGLVAVSLSLSSAGYMDTFRRALLEVLREQLVVVPQQRLSEETESYKQMVLDTFVGQEASSLETRLALLRCAGGDWRVSGKFVVHSNTGCDIETIMSLLKESFIPYVCRHRPFLWPRHRWTGMEKSLKDIGLLLCIHNLLPAVYERWLALQFGRSAALPSKELLVDVGVSELNEPPAGAKPESVAWAEANKAHRRGARDWLATSPGVATLLMRVTLSPMMWYLTQELELSNLSLQKSLWSASKESLGLEGLLQLLQRGRWPLLLAATGELDREAMERVRQAHSEDQLRGVPSQYCQARWTNFLFRMLSRQGSSLHQLVLTKHKCFPFKLLRLVADPSLGAELLQTCRASRDPWSHSFLEHYKESIAGEEALLELACVILMGKTSIARLESLHATIRRGLTVSSVQCPTPDLSMVSANYLLGKICRREAETQEPGIKVQRKRKKRRVTTDESGRRGTLGIHKAPRQAGGGGAWRAFISEQCKHLQKASFSTLAVAYKNLTLGDKQRLQESGAEATLTHRAGGVPFGLSSRRVARLQAKARQQEMGVRLAAHGQLPLPSTSTIQDLEPVGLSAALADRRQEVSALRHHRSQQERADAHALWRWQQQQGRTIVNNLVSSLPSLGIQSPYLRALPAGQDVFCMQWRSPCGTLVPQLLGALQSQGETQLLQNLEDEWKKLHLLKVHNQQQALDDDGPSKQKPSCLEAGLCLCGVRGQAIFELKEQFLKSTMAILNTQALRKQMSAGDVVLRLEGVYHPQEEDDDGEGCGGAVTPHILQHWLHVSLMFWKPLRPTFRKLVDVTTIAGPLGVRTLQCSHVYRTVWEQAECMYMEDLVRWTVEVFMLRDSCKPVVQLDPAHIEVYPLGKVGASFSNERKRRAARDPLQQWDSALQKLVDTEEASADDSEGFHDNDDDGEHGSDSGMAPHPGEDVEMLEDEAPKTEAHQEALEVGGAAPVVGSGSSTSGSSSSSSSSSSTSSSSSGSSSQGDDEGDEAGEVQPLGQPPQQEVAHAPRAVVAEGAVRGRADLCVILVGGAVLRFYENSSSMVMHCNCVGHGTGCRLTRTVKGSNTRGRAGQGRPLGLLLAWAEWGVYHRDHKQHIQSRPFPPLADRRRCRQAALREPSLAPFFAVEHNAVAGHEHEPDVVP